VAFGCRQAKERKVRIWKDYVSKGVEIDPKQREISGKVVQIVNADAIAIKMTNGEVRTIHLSSVRPPRYIRSWFKITSSAYFICSNR